MIIKFSLVRLSVIFLLVILFPLVQKQWLNLFLFDINSFSIYKLLYYLSGLVVPILIVINSLNKFTYYKFNYHNKNKKNFDISGKLLLLLSFIVLTTLSILISSYVLVNINIFLNFFVTKKEYLVQFYGDKQILCIVIVSIFLIFKKTKYFIKKIILTNFFIFSIITWFLQINNSKIVEIVPFYFFKLGHINFINIAFILAIEIVFYLWSYISYSSYLSDWLVPRPYKNEVLPILNIIIFYLLIIFYYSILFK